MSACQTVKQSGKFGLLAILVLALSLGMTVESSAGWWKKHSRRFHGSGDIVTQTREVKDFDAIIIRGVADVEVVFADEFGAEIRADEELIDFITLEVSHHTLYLDLDEEIDNYDFDVYKDILIRITMPKLSEINVEGVGDILVERYSGDNLIVELSGVGDIVFKDFTGETLEVDLSGVGDIKMAGKVRDLSVTVSGVGDADLRKLESVDAVATVSGMGDLLVRATRSLKARVSGFGDIRYYGDPEKVRRSISGFGDIHASH